MAKQPSSLGSSPDRSAPLVSDRSAQASQPADAGARAQGTVAARRVPPSQQDKRYIEDEARAGTLVDVDETTNLSTLSSRVRWVRFPNGDVQRILID